MQYSGSGTLQEFSGNATSISYNIKFPGVGNIGKIEFLQPNVDILKYINKEVDLHLEGGRLLQVTLNQDGSVIFNSGNAIGFED